MANKPEVKLLSSHRDYVKNYTPEQFIAEVANIVRYGGHTDFLFSAGGSQGGGRSTRIGTIDPDRPTHVGDLLMLNEYIKEDILSS